VGFVVDQTAFQRHLNQVLALVTFTLVLQCPPWVKRHISSLPTSGSIGTAAGAALRANAISAVRSVISYRESDAIRG
jgi:hypothetical protein